MKILDIVYPYFTLEHDGQAFQVKEIIFGGERFYDPSNIENDFLALKNLINTYDGETIQTIIRNTIVSFENEMNCTLAALDVEKDLTYSERYILSMEGH